jgi:hypothetical protein
MSSSLEGRENTVSAKRGRPEVDGLRVCAARQARAGGSCGQRCLAISPGVKTLPATDGARVSSTKVDLCSDPSDRPSPRLAVALALIGGLVWCDEFEVARERRLEREARRAEKRTANKVLASWF